MVITMDQRLRNLRKRSGSTQEALATYLGITPQSVSKWERGEGLPDISFLPELAKYYNVSVDYLLGMDDNAFKVKMQKLLQTNTVLINEEKADKRVDLWRAAAREFPNKTEILLQLVFALRAENEKKNADEIIRISQLIMKNTTLSGEYFGAIFNICRSYAAKGDIKSAIEYASKAGRYIGTENQIMIQILEGERAAQYCTANIECLMDLLGSNAGIMLKKGVFNAEKAVNICKTVIKIYETILENDAGFYHCRLAKWNVKLASYLIEENNTEKANEAIKSALMHAQLYDRLSDGSYSSSLLYGLRYTKSADDPSLYNRLLQEIETRCHINHEINNCK